MKTKSLCALPALFFSLGTASPLVGALAATQAIDAKRMFPGGISFAAPVATNTSEEGQAKNRRVELVEMTAARSVAAFSLRWQPLSW